MAAKTGQQFVMFHSQEMNMNQQNGEELNTNDENGVELNKNSQNVEMVVIEPEEKYNVYAAQNVESEVIDTDLWSETKFLPHQCDICSKSFHCDSNLRRHVRTIHHCEIAEHRNCYIRCCICAFESRTFDALLQHLIEVHQVMMEQESQVFDSDERFNEWKKNMEVETTALFVRQRGTKRKGGEQRLHYFCHRSGSFASKGTGKKQVKVQGSNKIGAICPAHLQVTKKPDNSIQVLFVKTHLGHTMDLGRIPLSYAEKKEIADKLAAHMSIDAIVDEVRKAGDENCSKRLSLLTRRDVLNIRKEFKLQDTVILRNSNLPSGTPGRTRQRKKKAPVPKEEEEEEEEDMLASIIQSAQVGTTETNGEEEGGEVTTILVLNNSVQGYPAAFILRSGQDDVPVTFSLATAEEMSLQAQMEEEKTKLKQLVETINLDLDRCETLEQITTIYSMLVPVQDMLDSWVPKE